MKRNQVRLMVILGTFAITGIFLVQIYWLQKAWSISEKQFNQTIFIALKNVANKLSVFNQSVLPAENIVNQLSSNYFVVNVNSIIDANILEYYLKTEFEKLNMRADYEYAIYDCHNDQMVYGNYISMEGSEKPIALSTNLPKYSEYLYYFGINFPKKTSFLSGNMTIWTIFSAILLISVIFFAYSIFIVLQQKRLSELQKDFINNMTHEFKTPISSINISADVITNPEITKDPRRLLNYGAIIKQENNRLNKQVEKVLQIARIEKSGFELKPEQVKLIGLIQDVASNCRANYDHVSISIIADPVDANLQISADKLHLTNIIYNLLDNAIKYSGNNPDIMLRIFRKSKKIMITVKDHGPGISREYQKKVFQKFFRIPTGNVHDVKGFGLGLYYVKSICAAHKWKIKLDSEPGKGSEFIIEIPIT